MVEQLAHQLISAFALCFYHKKLTFKYYVFMNTDMNMLLLMKGWWQKVKHFLLYMTDKMANKSTVIYSNK